MVSWAVPCRRCSRGTEGHVSRGGQAATRAADLPTSITAQVRDEIARLADGMHAPFSVWLVLIYFGPTPPAGKEHNWVQTIPGKGWYTGLRLYGPLEPWFDKTWCPGEIELLP